MPKTRRAIFDGEVLRPEEPVDLQPNTWYVVTIEREDQEKTSDQPDYPLTQLRHLATDMGIADLSTRHSVCPWAYRGRYAWHMTVFQSF